MRYLPDVITSILEHVPENMVILRDALEDIQLGLKHIPPEIIQVAWKAVHKELIRRLDSGVGEEEWKTKVWKIWTGEKDES